MRSALVLSIIAIAFVSVLESCKKDEEPVDYRAADKKIIQDYIKANNLDADSTSSGLYYVIDVPGSGDFPNQYSDVKVRYKGYFTDGGVFDESTSGIRFNLSQVIAGWTEGIPKFKEGGSGILLIPSHLGYGSQETGSIPANSVLIFDIKLDEVY